MKVSKLISGVAVTAVSMVALGTAPVSATTATTPSNTCNVNGAGIGQAGFSFSVVGTMITSTFEVTGTNCTTPVTLAVWKSPADSVDTIDQSVSEQKLFAHTTNTFGPGMHSLSTQLPDCFYQADLLLGDKATAPDGTPNYAIKDGEILKVHPLRDFKFGGTKKCEVPKTPEDPKTPETPNSPEQPKEKGKGQGQVLAAQTPTELTGAGPEGMIATFAGVSASASAAHAVVTKAKRKLRK
jgi:hypothetical protein